METALNINTVDAYNKLYGLHTLHPLAAVVDLSTATRMPSEVTLDFGLYALFLKNNEACIIKYGRKNYDYQEGTITSFAPGQRITIERKDGVPRAEVLGLVFHPDLIHGTSLGRKMNQYGFFDYAQNEALHLSEAERDTYVQCLHGIQAELAHPVDRHSRRLICVQIETVLDYCLRFYDRQFITRHKETDEVICKFEQLANQYFQGSVDTLPSVRYFADKVFLSPGYFGDLVKKELGISAQDYIQQKLINEGKNRLLGTGDSISQVAYSLGFQYPQHFIRLFKRKTGSTPGEYRHLHA